MPEFLVLQCFSCRAYQVQQAKKTRKWACVVCGERQSELRVYLRSGCPRDCREAVQRLNAERGRACEQAQEMACKGEVVEDEENVPVLAAKPSIWESFLEPTEDDSPDSEGADAEIVRGPPPKRPRKAPNCFRSHVRSELQCKQEPRASKGDKAFAAADGRDFRWDHNLNGVESAQQSRWSQFV
eukprot:RCo047770